MDDLAAYERRLAQEQEENARLENRILALKAEAERAEAKFSPAAKPRPTARAGASNGNTNAATIIEQLQAIQASLEASQNVAASAKTRIRDSDTASIVSGRGRASGSRSVVSATRSVSARSTGGRSTTSSIARQGTGGRATVVPDTAASAVTYRSAMYRSVSPSKRVTNGVVISNLSRAPRFRDEKVDVPGPGKYDPHSTDFRPVAVTENKIDDGNLGHTWALYKATTGVGRTPAQAHYDAMAQATARIRSPEPGERNLDAISPNTIGSSVSQMRPRMGTLGGVGTGTGTVVSTQTFGEGGVDAAVAAMIDSYHGDARAALAASIKRERALRKEVTLMRGNSNTVRLNAGQQANVLHNEIEGLKEKAIKKDKALSAAQAKLKAWTDVFLRADQTMAELAQWMTDAQSAASGSRNPALGKAADTVRALQAIIDSAAALTVGAGAANGSVMGEGLAGASVTGSVTNGYTAYSSLSAALVNPIVGAVGDLGGSHSVVAGQVAKQRAVAAAPPPPPPRERGLTGAQAAGLGLDATAARGVSAADIQAGTAAPVQRQAVTVSAADVASFARLAAGAITGDNGGASNASIIAAVRGQMGDSGSGAGAQPQAQPQQTQYQQQQQQAGQWGYDATAPLNVGQRGQAQPQQHLQSQQMYGQQGHRAPATYGNNASGAASVSTTAGPSSNSANAGASALSAALAGFAEAFLRPDVLSFFNEHRGALQGLFGYYSSQGGAMASADRMNRRALLAFAADSRISPDMLPKSELVALAREVARAAGGAPPQQGAGSPGDKDVSISYPEWCELLGLVAHVTVTASQAQALIGTASPSMLQKLQLLIVDMAHRGASGSWPAHLPEIHRMVRTVEGVVRAQAQASQAPPPAPAQMQWTAQGYSRPQTQAQGAVAGAQGQGQGQGQGDSADEASRAATRAAMARFMNF